MTTRRGAGTRSPLRWAAAALLAAAVALTGCSSGADSTASSADHAVPESAAAADSAAGTDAGAAEAEQLAATVGAAEADRSVIVSGSIVLTADDPIEVAGLVVGAVETAGGYLDGRSESQGEGSRPAQARLTVRVPPGEVQPMIDSLRGIGTVTEVDLTSSDVTQQVADLETRISAKRVAIARLEELLSGAGTMADLLAVENELTTRQTELEQLLTEQAGIDDLTAMATLEVSVYATDQEPAPTDDDVSGFLGGLEAGWEALVRALGAAVTVAGVLLPWLVLLALVGAIVTWVTRRGRRRRPPVRPHVTESDSDGTGTAVLVGAGSAGGPGSAAGERTAGGDRHPTAGGGAGRSGNAVPTDHASAAPEEHPGQDD